MTNDQYSALLESANKTYLNLTRSAMQKLKETYEEAARMAAVAMRKARKAGHANITIESWNQLYIQLRQGAQLIQDAIYFQVPITANKGVEKYGSININYLVDAIKESGTDKITKIGITNMITQINDRVILSIVNRVYQDGYSFSQRCWQAGQYYQEQIKRVVSAGLAQGRDVISIAKDIQIYTKRGSDVLRYIYAKRYGEKLLPGTKEFLRRVGKKVDYRALRLVRSELYASLQESAKEQGRVNPACTGWYDWVRTTTAHYGCDCPENERNSPYEYHNVPTYEHPNCLCYIRQVLRNHRAFVNDLVNWTKGEQISYLDNWYNNIYSYYS